jgi:hypothetical protein
MLKECHKAVVKLQWMRKHRIWPNGPRDLWTDAFGLVLLVSLYLEYGESRYLEEAEWIAGEVSRVLSRPRGLRVGEGRDSGGQSFHHLAMWMYALGQLGTIRPEYLETAVQLARDVHPAFVIPGAGVISRMEEDLTGPFQGSGFGPLDHFHGYVVYRKIGQNQLKQEIRDMKLLVERTYRDLFVTQDLGLGMMLWGCHFFPDEPWAKVQYERALKTLEAMWINPPGYFCREPYMPYVKFAFTNYGISLGLQSVEAHPDRVALINAFFENYYSGDEHDANGMTHIMACTSYFPGCFI